MFSGIALWSTRTERMSAPLVLGDRVREWTIPLSGRCRNLSLRLRSFKPRDIRRAERLLHLWPYRTILANRLTFGKRPSQRGLPWYGVGMSYSCRTHRSPLSIAFAFVATHNHFVLDRGGKVFKQSAPVIKLPEGATERRPLELLGLLNRSTACFWLKQVCHNKGSTVDGGGPADDRGVGELLRVHRHQAGAVPAPEGVADGAGCPLDGLASDLQGVSAGGGARVGCRRGRRWMLGTCEWERIRRADDLGAGGAGLGGLRPVRAAGR